MTNPHLLAVRRQHPPFLRAVAADARCHLAYRGEGHEFTSKVRLVIQIIRLCWVADAFLAQVMYRARVRLERFRVPLIPAILHRLSMIHSQVCIGSPVVIEPGLYIAHGQVVVDGFTSLESGVVIFPWVTIGLRGGKLRGPHIGAGTHIGTGAKVIGPVVVGGNVRIGANAVVTTDIPSEMVAAGIPARVIKGVEPLAPSIYEPPRIDAELRLVNLEVQ